MRPYLLNHLRRDALLLPALICAVLLLSLPAPVRAAHGIAQFGAPRYAAGFTHFDYANPQAPKGGQLALSVISQNSAFDKFNPFSLKGRPAPGVLELMFETLAVYSLDERNTHYGLLARDILVAPDFSGVTFRLRDEARFSNGDPVTASDVRHSFETLRGPLSSPKFQSYFAEIRSAEVIDAKTIRFRFTRKGRDLAFIAGSLPVFSPRWGGGVTFDKLRLEQPVASGPYLIDSSGSSQAVSFRLNPHYWGRDTPTRKGMFNFGRITYNLYSDSDSRRAALRSAKYDFFSETQMWPWRVMYFGENFDNGTLVREVLPHQNPPAMNGWVVNLRKPRFQDVRVRQALNHLFDYEWLNDKAFSGRFKRMDSYFARTPLAATGLPGPDEIALLEPYRAELPAAVFGPMLRQPTTHDGHSIRDNMRDALALFAAAGWHNRDGVLRNARGEPFVIEISINARKQSVLDSVYRNLRKAGVIVNLRLSDPATERRNLSRFDFDHTAFSLRESRMPGDEIWRSFNSASAAVPGSENLAGVSSRAVDALTQRLLNAGTQHEQETAARALDRVLMHGHYVIPWRYLPDHYLIYNKRLRRPDILPTYYAAQEWAVMTWWDGSARP